MLSQCTLHVDLWYSNQQCCQWRKAENPSYKHVIAAYGTAMTDITSQIAYEGCPKICHSHHLTTLLFK